MIEVLAYEKLDNKKQLSYSDDAKILDEIIILFHPFIFEFNYY